MNRLAPLNSIIPVTVAVSGSAAHGRLREGHHRWNPGSRVAACLRWLFIALCLFARPAAAQWTVAQLDDLARAFASAMAMNYNVTAYPWSFMTDCDLADCLSNNPDTIYGYPNFATQPGALVWDRQMASTSALVFVLETPPPMRYFGVTAYMGNKYYARLPGRPQMSGTVAVNESLTDTTNIEVVGTTGSPTPGTNPFSQLAVFVVTADARTYADISTQFTALGFPGTAVNQLALPISVQPAVPLNMGTTPNSDTYTAALRLTYPLDPAKQADYVQRSPIRTFYLAPKGTRLITPVPPTSYRTPGTGVAEPAALSAAQGQLVNQLLAQYATQYATITENRVGVAQTVNYNFIAKGKPGNFDNPDALYVADAGGNGNLAPAADDRILVVGVNHSSPVNGTGKASYFSHTLEVVDTHAGVFAVADSWLDMTGLVAAGITDANDPRYDTYRRLYAFSLSYNCPPGDTLCITIPQGTGGVPIGTPVELIGRIYLEPATRTRPSKNELIVERVFVMSKAGAPPR
jgi:hypothetical protein